MTSGVFSAFPVDKIWVDRDERQRRELDGLDELLASMNRIGQINPIVIQHDGKLVAGERRLSAAQLGGWTSINVQFVEDLPPDELQLLELEENIKRASLPWQDECLAVARYHNLRSVIDPKWTITNTAEALSMTQSSASQKLAVAREITAGNKRVVEAPKFSVARGVIARVEERRKADGLSTALKVGLPGAAVPAKLEAPILNTDFTQWLHQYDGPQFNFLHCDFPYGVNADKHDQGQAAAMGGYEDSFEVYNHLLSSLTDATHKIIAPSAHMIFWFSMDYYQFTLDALTSSGWAVNPFPLVWFKSDNTGILPDYRRGPRRNYETAFLCTRGDRLLTASGAVSNVCAWPGRDKDIHMSEKPVGMLKHFMSMVVDDLTIMLDPTCGSGNAMKAAQALKAKSVLGLEIDEEFYTRAKEAYFND